MLASSQAWAFALFLLLCCFDGYVRARHAPSVSAMSLGKQPPVFVEDTTRRRLTTVDAVPLAGTLPQIGSYYVTLSMGTPARSLRVVADTGSSALVVYSQSTASKAACHTRYYETTSSTGSTMGCEGNCARCTGASQCYSYLAYGDGTWFDGYLVTDKVTLGSMTSMVTFNNPTTSSTDALGCSLDGIMGLSFGKPADISCSPTCVATVFDQMAAAYSLPKIYSMCMGVNSGMLFLGGDNSSYYYDSPLYIPLQTSGAMFVSFTSFKVGDVLLDLTSSVPSGGALIDSGSTLMILPLGMFSSLKTYFTSSYCYTLPTAANQTTCQFWMDTIFDSYCLLGPAPYELFPNITFGLGNLVMGLRPQEWLYPSNITGRVDKFHYCLGISSQSSSAANYAILGETFMQRYFVTFDMENNQIGFARRVSSLCGGNAVGDIDAPAGNDTILVIDTPPSSGSDSIFDFKLWYLSFLIGGPLIGGYLIYKIATKTCCAESKEEQYRQTATPTRVVPSQTRVQMISSGQRPPGGGTSQMGPNVQHYPSPGQARARGMLDAQMMRMQASPGYASTSSAVHPPPYSPSHSALSSSQQGPRALRRLESNASASSGQSRGVVQSRVPIVVSTQPQYVQQTSQYEQQFRGEQRQSRQPEHRPSRLSSEQQQHVTISISTAPSRPPGSVSRTHAR